MSEYCRECQRLSEECDLLSADINKFTERVAKAEEAMRLGAEASATLREESIAKNGRIAELEAEFKNFHRLLCERFGYAHDPVDWRRDQLSLIEHIAERQSETPIHPPKDWYCPNCSCDLCGAVHGRLERSELETNSPPQREYSVGREATADDVNQFIADHAKTPTTSAPPDRSDPDFQDWEGPWCATCGAPVVQVDPRYSPGCIRNCPQPALKTTVPCEVSNYNGDPCSLPAGHLGAHQI
jgi:hypothetical protein